MKAIFVVALTALLMAFASTTSPPECPSGQSVTFLPNPDDCSTFYHCDREEPLLMQCNEGLEFNPKLKVCDWPKKTVTCIRRPSAPARPPHSPTPTTTPTRPPHSPTPAPASAKPPHSSAPTPETITASPDMAPVELTV